MKSIILITLMFTIMACSTSTPKTKPLIKARTSTEITKKTLHAFHLAYVKKCDAAFASHDPFIDVTKLKLSASSGWLTINGHSFTGSCFNKLAHKHLNTSIFRRIDDETLNRLAPRMIYRVSRDITNHYFMTLYPDEFKPVTKKEAQAYYHANKSKFQVPVKVSLKTIMVHVNDAQTIKDQKTPLQIVTDLDAELKVNPSQFDTFSKRYSNRPPDHSRLHVNMIHILEEQFPLLKVNETSKPIKVKNMGYVIIRKYIEKESHLPPFEELEAKINKDLFEAKKQKALKTIKAKYTIEHTSSKLQPTVLPAP